MNVDPSVDDHCVMFIQTVQIVHCNMTISAAFIYLSHLRHHHNSCPPERFGRSCHWSWWSCQSQENKRLQNHSHRRLIQHRNWRQLQLSSDRLLQNRNRGLLQGRAGGRQLEVWTGIRKDRRSGSGASLLTRRQGSRNRCRLGRRLRTRNWWTCWWS